MNAVQFLNLRNTMVATLPRVYMHDGRTPMESHPNSNSSIGAGVDVDRFSIVLTEMRQRVGDEVFGPMTEWNKDYKKIQVCSHVHTMATYR